MQKLTQWLVYGFSALIVLSGFIYYTSHIALFKPPKPHYQTLPGLHYLKTQQGKLAYIYLKNPRAHFTILYSHGNADDLQSALPRLKALQQHGFNVIGYDYSGYGTSTGWLSEYTTYLNAIAIYHFLRRQGLTPSHIVLLGHSLGTGVTVQLGMQLPAAGMILESPFISAYRTKTAFNLPLLLFDKFNNLKKIKHVHMPLLITHGTADATVPFQHGVMLYHAANQPKFFYSIPGAGHSNFIATNPAMYWAQIKRFTHFLRRHHAQS